MKCLKISEDMIHFYNQLEEEHGTAKMESVHEIVRNGGSDHQYALMFSCSGYDMVNNYVTKLRDGMAEEIDLEDLFLLFTYVNKKWGKVEYYTTPACDAWYCLANGFLVEDSLGAWGAEVLQEYHNGRQDVDFTLEGQEYYEHEVEYGSFDC